MVILELVDRKWIQKTTLFATMISVFWRIWRSKKSYSGLFRSCFGVVYEVFMLCVWTLKSNFCVFSARKFDKWPLKLKISVKNLLILGAFRGLFDNYGAKKIAIWTNSKLFRKCLGAWALLLALKDQLLVVFTAQKVNKSGHTRNFRSIICSFWWFWWVILDHKVVKKVVFRTFSKLF